MHNPTYHPAIGAPPLPMKTPLRSMQTISTTYRANVGSFERISSIAGGAILAMVGFTQLNRPDLLEGFTRGGTRRRPLDTLKGALLVLAGGMLARRGLSGHCPVYEKLGIHAACPGNESGVRGNSGISGMKLEKRIWVNRSRQEVFDCCRRLENLSVFLPHVKSVVEAEDGISHWIVDCPAGNTLEWDAELVNQHPGEMIAWQSLPHASLHNAGSIRFIDEGKGTEVRLALKYQLPEGDLGVAVGAMVGECPEQKLEESLLRFKQWIETGVAQLA